jgi:hypothetical protein
MTPPIETAETEVITDAHVVERERTHLNENEHSLIKELLRPGASIEAVIPADATAEKLWDTLDACVRGFGLLETRMLRLKPIIGKILLIFENKPSLYKALGYDTFSDFMRRGVEETLGAHHTWAYEGHKLAKHWEQVTPDQYAKIGPKKMNTLSKFCTGRSRNAEEWLAAAETMKVSEFNSFVEQRGFLSQGESTGATIIIPTNRNILAHWKEFCKDKQIQEGAGSKQQDGILEALMQIGEAELRATAEGKGRQKIETTKRTGPQPSTLGGV